VVSLAASYRLACPSHPRRTRLPAIGGLLVALALAQALALAPAPPVAAASYPMELVDDAGNPVRLEAPPQRIVSLVPSLTEAVCALDACDRLVGVDDYSNYPPQVMSLPRLGGLYDPNVERIVALGPDLVLLSKYGRLPQVLRQAGLTVFILESETLEDAFRNLTTLGRLLDREDRATRLVDAIQREMQRIADLVRASGRSPSVYYEIDPTPYAAGPDSFIGALIELAGGRNVVPAHLGLFPRISPELVIQADPDVIVLGDAPYGVTARQLAERPGWAALSALREGRVAELDAAQVDLVSRPGPRVAEAVRLLAALLHPALRDELGAP